MERKICCGCKRDLTKRQQVKYCSNKCQLNAQYTKYIEAWKKGRQDGNRGIKAKNISKHLKKYLLEKYNNCCSICKWNKKHPKTGKIPLEIDHIDGNAENNSERNLRLLCPNCHSLTDNFKNLNRGNGRIWRMEKYKRNK
jgi:hypothetical protein